MDASQRGKSSRRKGADAERELVRILRENFDVRRGMVFNHEPDVVGLDGIHVEVKYQQNLNLLQAVEQAKESSKTHGGIPAVFHKKSRKGWYVTMELNDWLVLYQAFNLIRQGEK